MKRLLPKLTVIFALLLCSTLISSCNYGQNDKRTVYICTGPKSKAFHADSDCRGLNKCSDEVKAISMRKAVKKGRKPCRICCSSSVMAAYYRVIDNHTPGAHKKQTPWLGIIVFSFIVLGIIIFIVYDFRLIVFDKKHDVGYALLRIFLDLLTFPPILFAALFFLFIGLNNLIGCDEDLFDYLLGIIFLVVFVVLQSLLVLYQQNHPS